MTVVESRAKIGARYELIERVAVGGMGEVWRAVDELLRRPVAVKVLRGQYANDPQFRENLRQEARASAGVAHPNVAWVFDYGEEDDGQGNRFAYVVMELVEGESLGSLLARRGRLTAAQTMQVVAQVAEALRAAHERQLVHRDIKPGNLLVRPDGVVKITDFGIAHAADAAPAVPAGTTFGSIPYISPEQAVGADTTWASDVYSLGVVAYQCLAGHLPFADADPRALARAHVERTPPDLPADVPPAIAGFVLRMLAKDVSRRPPSARAVAQEAVSWLAFLGERQPLVDAMVGWTPRPARSTAASPPGPGDATGVVPIAGPADATGVVPDWPGADPDATGPMWGDTSAFLPLSPPRRRGDSRRRRRLARTGAVAAALVLALAAALVLVDKPSGATDLAAPTLVGHPVAQARSQLAAMGLSAAVRPVDRPGLPGTVLAQSPSAGTRLRRGATVTLDEPSGYVVLDPATVDGKTAAQAKAVLAADGLKAVTRTGAPSAGGPGTVTAASPTGRLPTGTTVTLTVAGAAASSPTAPAAANGAGSSAGTPAAAAPPAVPATPAPSPAPAPTTPTTAAPPAPTTTAPAPAPTTTTPPAPTTTAAASSGG